MLNQEDLAKLHEAADLYNEAEYEKAFDIFSYLAEEHNDDESQFFLGLMYSNGHHVEKDMGQAEYWWRKAAAQRNQDATFQLESLSFSTKNSRY